MRNFLLAMTNALNMIKGFECGHTTRVNNGFLVDYDGRRFLVKFTELKDTNTDKDMFKDMDKYL